MNYYTAKYQAPYRYNSTSTYEPDGSSTTNGSNLFDTVNFCLDCHATRLTSTRLGRRTYAIDWSSSGDEHGKNWDGSSCCVKAPYGSGNYVLSCLDCHEPHGSPNAFLLRQEVNGTNVNILNGGPINRNWCYFCSACHSQGNGHGAIPGNPSNPCGGMTSCDSCHRHGNPSSGGF
jgi:hypothetical protein